MINFQEALDIVVNKAEILDVENVDLLASLNKVLGEDVFSKDNLPPFNKSAMDGYAIKSSDTEQANAKNRVMLDIVGTIKAGDWWEGELKSRQAIRIMTGAPLPKGADSVIEFEEVKVEADKLYLDKFIKEKNNVIKLGEEVKIGELILEKGKEIRPVEIGLLATLGYSKVSVHKNPTVALIITGDELINIDDELVKGKIRNSNEYSLIALVNSLGANVLSLGIVQDDKGVIRDRIKFALENADIIISSGGASSGDYDYIEDILKEIGLEVQFNSVGVKPGKPVIFATYNKKLFFGLPGNPLAIITTFEEFVKPALEIMLGKISSRDKEFPVILGEDFKVKPGRRKYIYVNLKEENGVCYAYKTGNQSSSHLVTISRSNGVIIIPEECGEVKAGDVFNGKYLFR